MDNEHAAGAGAETFARAIEGLFSLLEERGGPLALAEAACSVVKHAGGEESLAGTAAVEYSAALARRHLEYSPSE